jgi:hypothetical protein
MRVWSIIRALNIPVRWAVAAWRVEREREREMVSHIQTRVLSPHTHTTHTHTHTHTHARARDLTLGHAARAGRQHLRNVLHTCELGEGQRESVCVGCVNQTG